MAARWPIRFRSTVDPAGVSSSSPVRSRTIDQSCSAAARSRAIWILLRRVRLAEPDAEIWFRPHPDVDAGHRRRRRRLTRDALLHVDRVVRGGGMASAAGDQVDAVHVLTSLTGFEALLRGREVVCHGVPFFAGWGLTRDLAPPPRPAAPPARDAGRTRRGDVDPLPALSRSGHAAALPARESWCRGLPIGPPIDPACWSACAACRGG